jgi:hypothetical protein
MQRTITFLVSFLWSANLALAAGPLTLPYSDKNTPLWQGWYYELGAYHGGIDYGTSSGTPILAAMDGYAVSWYQPYNPNGGGYSYGEYVLMYHPSIGKYTLYAHLDDWEDNIPRKPDPTYPGSGGWLWVKRGVKIGTAGKTGTDVCHLHFELSSGGYATRRIDPYGIYAQRWSYPGCGVPRRGVYHFTACPPVPPATAPPTGNCNSPGSFKDIPKGGDFDGNGKLEFARYYGAVGRWDTALSTGSSFGSLKQAICGHGVGSSWQSTGDINGDGIDDAFVFFNSTGLGYVALGRSNGTFAPYYQTHVNPIMQNLNEYWLEDVNGDGNDDWVGNLNGGKWYISLSDGSKFTHWMVAIVGHGDGSTNRLLADVNGDGRADAIVYFSNDGSWYVAYGRADGKFGPTYTRFAVWHGSGSTSRHMADLNGDGKKDAVAFWNYDTGVGESVVRVWLSDGTGFIPNNSARATGQGFDSSLRIFADATGDKKDDFWFFYPAGGWYVAPSTGGGYMNASPW